VARNIKWTFVETMNALNGLDKNVQELTIDDLNKAKLRGAVTRNGGLKKMKKEIAYLNSTQFFRDLDSGSSYHTNKECLDDASTAFATERIKRKYDVDQFQLRYADEVTRNHIFEDFTKFRRIFLEEETDIIEKQKKIQMQAIRSSETIKNYIEEAYKFWKATGQFPVLAYRKEYQYLYRVIKKNPYSISIMRDIIRHFAGKQDVRIWLSWLRMVKERYAPNF